MGMDPIERRFDLYKEILEQERFLSEFRRYVITGWASANAAVGSAIWLVRDDKASDEWQRILALVWLGVIYIFWAADKRNRDGFKATRSIGKRLEDKLTEDIGFCMSEGQGYFHQIGPIPRNKKSHSRHGTLIDFASMFLVFSALCVFLSTVRSVCEIVLKFSPQIENLAIGIVPISFFVALIFGIYRAVHRLMNEIR